MASRNDQAPAPEGASDPRRLLGRVISGRYRIDELVGEGGMGAVYRAEHTHMHKRLAVKVLHPEMLGLSEAVERFEREAIAGAHIEHPNVASAIDFGKLEDGSHFLVLEFLEGEDLRTVVGRSALPPERAVKIVRQIALALRAAHQLGIVHRDLKPENIMLVRKDRDADVVKVLDFGIAKVPVQDITQSRRSGAALTKLGMVYGTPEYMSPEQALGEEIDGRADLYALGVMFYEILCGVRPFEAKTRTELLGLVATKEPPPLAERVPGTIVPPEVEEIVMRLLRKSAADRYADADALIEALDIAILELDYHVAPSRVMSSRASFPDRSGPYRPLSASTPDPPAGAEVLRPSPEPMKAAALGAQAATRGGAAQGTSHRAMPRAALVAGLGFAAIGALIVLAVVVRGEDSVKALEEAELGPQRAPAGSAASSAAGARTAAAADGTAAAAATGVAPAAERPPGSTAPDSELAAAKEAGLTALGPLAQRYPTDPAVLKALMLAHAKDRTGYIPAVAVATRLVDAAPEMADDDQLRQTMLRIANGPPDAADAALDAMATKMGSRGPDLLYELVTAPSVGKYPRDRANALLARPQVKALETPALAIANELRVASGCGRKPLLARAARDGDARALGFLTPLLATTGCGVLFMKNRDCYPCLGSRKELKAAIDAIQHRIDAH